MILSIIVAASENNAIGKDNDLIWHISADLRHFKQLTQGHTVLMGRKTFQSIGRPLPRRRNIVISGSEAFHAEGCEHATGIEEALEMVKGEDEVFVIGGGSIYRELWNRADRLYLTRVHTVVDADTFIPEVDEACWKEAGREEHRAGEKDDFDCSFIRYEKSLSRSLL